MGQGDRTISLLSKLAGRPADIEQLLFPGRVAVVLTPGAAPNTQAQLISSFAINLLARLYPVVQNLDLVVPGGIPLRAQIPRWKNETLDGHLCVFLRALSSPVNWTVTDTIVNNPVCSLVIGTANPTAREVIYVGSDGWNAYLSPEKPLGCGDNVNPVGAYAAACLAVGEITKRLLFLHRDRFEGVPILPLKEPLSFSAFTYLTSSSDSNPALESSFDLGRLTIVGLGAGGAAAVYTLASLPDLTGSINLIEPDEIEDGNLNRYVHADAGDAGRLKTEVAREIFRRFPGVKANPFPLPFGKASSRLEIEDFRYVLAAVHSREARRELQYETPMVLWDGGATEHGEFRVWRMILGRTECMHCKHPPGQRDPERESAAQLSQLLGLNPEIWLRKIRDNEPFNAEEAAVIQARIASKDHSFDLPTVGQRYGDWEKAQCGRLPFPDVDEEIPIPFAPVMAGVLLAGEILKEHCYPQAVLDSYYGNTLLGHFMRRMKVNRRRARGDCAFCHDELYLNQYMRRWGGHPDD